MFLNTFENRIIIQGKIKALSAIHIGNGKEGYRPQDVDNGIIRTAEDNMPFIPGSSLKGVLRSYLETILPNIQSEYSKLCIVTENPCWGTESEKKKLAENKKKYKNQPEELANVLYKQLCPICKLFGSQVMAAKVQIEDARPSNGFKVENRDGTAIDRDSGTAAHNKKYDFECVSAGTEFYFKMTINNLEKEYYKLIGYLIKYLKSGELRVGGKKSIGLGAVQLVDEAYYYIGNQEQLMTYINKGLTDEMRWDYAKEINK